MRLKIATLVIFLVTGLAIFYFEASISERGKNDPVLRQLVTDLAKEGYEVVEIETTWLGRLKVEAHSNKFDREIVLAPGAGTILRDDIFPLEDGDDS